jgi:undecaprenyl pyrophosphate phosphatase UppP
MNQHSQRMTMIATLSLAIILMAMVAVMLIGLFHDKVNNDKVFEMLSPAFQTIVGGFIGLITGIKIGQSDE